MGDITYGAYEGESTRDPRAERLALRTVCRNARDAAEAAEFVEALGLTDALSDLRHLRALGRGIPAAAAS